MAAVDVPMMRVRTSRKSSMLDGDYRLVVVVTDVAGRSSSFTIDFTVT